MSARFSHNADLAASPERVFTVLTDAELLVARYEASGSQAVQVSERRTTEDGGLVLIYRRVEAAGLPGPVARLVRGAAQITQTDRWGPAAGDGTRQATWTVETKGVAVTIGGTMTLTALGDGTRITEGGTVTARVPLIGTLVERLAVEQSGAKLRHEWEWLAAAL